MTRQCPVDAPSCIYKLSSCRIYFVMNKIEPCCFRYASHLRNSRGPEKCATTLFVIGIRSHHCLRIICCRLGPIYHLPRSSRSRWVGLVSRDKDSRTTTRNVVGIEWRGVHSGSLLIKYAVSSAFAEVYDSGDMEAIPALTAHQ
jgi:hypothetical protein